MVILMGGLETVIRGSTMANNDNGRAMELVEVHNCKYGKIVIIHVCEPYGKWSVLKF